MYIVSDKKIILVIFKFRFKQALIGNAVCTYEYDTIRDDFDNLLKIKLNFKRYEPLIKIAYSKEIEDKIKFTENSSQALNIIKSYIYPKYHGISIETDRTSYEFSFLNKQNKRIRMTKIETPVIEYEITNIETGKSYVLTSVNEDEIIDVAFDNL